MQISSSDSARSAHRLPSSRVPAPVAYIPQKYMDSSRGQESDGGTATSLGAARYPVCGVAPRRFRATMDKALHRGPETGTG